MTGLPSITQLLVDWSNGDRAALDEVTRRVYPELRTLARMYLSRDRRNQTLQPTALINEVYLRLIDQSRPVHWESRSHFFGIAARLMRLVLVDYSRAHRADKRGGGAAAVTLEDTMAFAPGNDGPDILAVDEAMSRLAQIDQRMAGAVELRYFGGLTCDEIACSSGVSVATVKRDLRLGEAWLRRHLASHG